MLNNLFIAFYITEKICNIYIYIYIYNSELTQVKKNIVKFIENIQWAIEG